MKHKQNIDLASLVLAQELHLIDHVVFPRAGVEILSPNHHQNILTALGKPFTTIVTGQSLTVCCLHLTRATSKRRRCRVMILSLSQNSELQILNIVSSL